MVILDMMTQSPLYWLLDIEAYDFNSGPLKKADLTGKVLIISTQLWSILRDDKVYSILVGPGYFKGYGEKKGIRVEIEEHISALMFDPTILRYDEPVPLVDIIKPEVIDPLSAREEEEIVTMVSHLVLERGNVLAVDPVAILKGGPNLPTVAHYTDMLKRMNVSHISGVQRARFILAGTNQPLYKPFVEWFNHHKYASPEKSKVLAIPFGRFASFSNIEIMSDWMIVEKAGVGGTGIEGFREEYEATIGLVRKSVESFIFEL